MKDIAIFGFKDSTVGQLINILPKDLRKKIKCFISISKLKRIDIKKENIKRPNNKTSFIKKGKIFNLPVYFSKNPIEILKKKRIKKVFILEDTGKDRYKIYNLIKKKSNIEILSFIHKSCKIMGENSLGEGTIIFPNNYLGYKSDIGKCCFIQSGCQIEHHNVIGNFCDINPRLTTGGFSKISDFCEINMSVNIINKIEIGPYSRIGAGSLVIKNIPTQVIAYGNPAKIKKKIKI